MSLPAKDRPPWLNGVDFEVHRSELAAHGKTSLNSVIHAAVFFPLLDLRVAFDIVCDNVGRDWKRLARQLKVSEAKIDGIEERYPRSLSEQVREALRVWKIAEREKATVAGLVKALRACRLNLVADLVEEALQAQGSVNENEGISPMLWDPTVSSSEAP